MSLSLEVVQLDKVTEGWLSQQGRHRKNNKKDTQKPSCETFLLWKKSTHTINASKLTLWEAPLHENVFKWLKMSSFVFPFLGFRVSYGELLLLHPFGWMLNMWNVEKMQQRVRMWLEKRVFMSMSVVFSSCEKDINVHLMYLCYNSPHSA